MPSLKKITSVCSDLSNYGKEVKESEASCQQFFVCVWNSVAIKKLSLPWFFYLPLGEFPENKAVFWVISAMHCREIIDMVVCALE